jgi:hypothetical protein
MNFNQIGWLKINQLCLCMKIVQYLGVIVKYFPIPGTGRHQQE